MENDDWNNLKRRHKKIESAVDRTKLIFRNYLRFEFAVFVIFHNAYYSTILSIFFLLVLLSQ